MNDNRRAGRGHPPPADNGKLPERAPRIGETVRVRTRRWLVEDVAEAATVPIECPS